MEEIIAAMGIGKDSDMIEEMLRKYDSRRVIVFNDDVSVCMMESVSLRILQWNLEDKGKAVESRQPIWLLIQSNGGDAIAGMNVLDVIQSSITPVYGVVFSHAASMAAYLIIACHKRYCFKNSVILIHDGTVAIQTSGKKQNDIVRFNNEVENRIRHFVISNTNITEEKYDSIYGDEFYIFGNAEGRELGIIDYVIGEDVKLSDIA